MAGVDYLAVQIQCPEDVKDILIAELSELEYDSMMETKDGLEAYIDQSIFHENSLVNLVKKYDHHKIEYEVQAVVSRNWNEEWEKNYDPISVDDRIYIRATFHEPHPNVLNEIVINPRMSFGTGHHSTTYLMLKNQLELEHQGQRVLDAGTGTGILAIMAEKLGAKDVIAYDNNSWSIENAPENLRLNQCKKIVIKEGTIGTLGLNGHFQIILANINKNVLLEEMHAYSNCLDVNGKLVLSGFYEDDAKDIISCALKSDLHELKRLTRNNWCSIIFTKSI